MARNPFKPVPVVALDDKALDIPAMAEACAARKESYSDTLDPALVIVKEGMTPTLFHLGLASGNFWAQQVSSQPTLSMKRRVAFLVSCHSITKADGTTMQAKTVKGAFEQPIADGEWFDLCFDTFGADCIDGIGANAVTLHGLPASARPTSSSVLGSARVASQTPRPADV